MPPEQPPPGWIAVPLYDVLNLGLPAAFSKGAGVLD
jgi:hypothetical protein